MPIRVLVVDDSALMRKHLRQILEEDPEFKVTTARDGQDALDQVTRIDPDVVTLDINMPVMDGLTCLSHLMHDHPRPVVMVSSLTDKGALATFEALELGAVDYVAKPGGTVSLNLTDVGHELRTKVRAAAGSKLRRSAGLANRMRAARSEAPRQGGDPVVARPAGPVPGLVLIGVSTGGPGTLETILPELPADFPWPIVVAQHMPGRFTKAFADRLDTRCALTVREVAGPTPLVAGEILIGKGDADVKVSRRGNGLIATSVPPDTSLWHPSVDRLVRSAMEHFRPNQLIAVELTGMGYDGAEAMVALHHQGGRVIAESEETAVVFGMPKEVIERGGADVVLPCERIANRLTTWVR